MTSPYTNPWSDVTPSDSSQANQIGADLRQLRLDIHQRMNSLVNDWTASPVTLQAQNSGAATGKIAMIAGSGFIPQFADVTSQYTQFPNGIYQQSVGGSIPPAYSRIIASTGLTPNGIQPAPLVCSIQVPNGITIIGIGAAIAACNIAVTVTFNGLFQTTGVTTTASPVLTFPISGSYQAQQQPTTNFLTSSTTCYAFTVATAASVASGTSFTLAACWIQYNTPSAANTI
jgi:hypothetical protein